MIFSYKGGYSLLGGGLFCGSLIAFFAYESVQKLS
jgi:hypothetical protein